MSNRTSLTVNSLPVFLAQRAASLGSLIRTSGLDLTGTDGSSPLSGGVFRSCVRVLGDGPTLALDADTPELHPSVDESTCSVLFPINTPSKDRMGDIVLPRGCIPLLQRNYGRNPRVFFSHHQQDMPIASARDADGRLAVEVQNDVIWSRAYFHMETPESRMIFALVARKELEAASIGFLPIKAAILEVSKEAERPETNEYGEDLIYFQDGHPWYPALRFQEWDLTEWSIVPIPANADCISMHLSRGFIDGEPITPLMRKNMEPYRLPKKVWSPGAVLDKSVASDALGGPVFFKEEQNTKRVDGEDLHKGAFAYRPNDDKENWKLPIKFSSDAKTKSHIRNAIARWSGTDMPDAGEKASARSRIKSAAKDHGIEVSEDALKDSPSPQSMKDTAMSDLVASVVDSGVLPSDPTPTDLVPTMPIAKDGGPMDDPLIALPGSQPPALQPAKEEPPMPLGAKFLRACMGHMDDHKAMCETACKELDHPKVKKYAEKRMVHMDIQATKCKALANKLYPEHFDEPDAKALEQLAQYQRAAVIELPNEVSVVTPGITPSSTQEPDPIDWSALKAQLDSMLEGQDRLNKAYFELTGINP